MDRLTPQKRKAIGLAFIGSLLIILGLKFMFPGSREGRLHLQLGKEPALLFFNLDESCECMEELVRSADAQVADWKETSRAGIPVHRIGFEANRDLVRRYQVFRVPCLMLLDSQGEIVYRQDYPLVEGGPLDLVDFEMQIQEVVRAAGK